MLNWRRRPEIELAVCGVDVIFARRVELLKEAFPQIKRVAAVFKPAGSGAQAAVDAMRSTAQSLGVGILEFPVRGAEDEIASPDQQDEGGICDVHSSSTQVGTDGIPYNQY